MAHLMQAQLKRATCQMNLVDYLVASAVSFTKQGIEKSFLIHHKSLTIIFIWTFLKVS